MKWNNDVIRKILDDLYPGWSMMDEEQVKELRSHYKRVVAKKYHPDCNPKQPEVEEYCKFLTQEALEKDIFDFWLDFITALEVSSDGKWVCLKPERTMVDEVLIIPDGIYGIYENGFCDKGSTGWSEDTHYMDAVKKVVIPSSVRLIGNFAFRFCRNLKTVTFSPRNTDTDTLNVGTGIFSRCGSLKEVDFPENTVFNGDVSKSTVFEDSSIREFVYHSRMKILSASVYGATVYDVIGQPATKSLRGSRIKVMPNKSVRFHDHIIGEHLFKNIYFPYSPDFSEIFPDFDEVIKIDAGAFDCTDIPGESKWSRFYLEQLPEKLEYLGDEAFKGCRCKATIKLPSTLTEIGREAFAGCVGLKTIIGTEKQKAMVDEKHAVSAEVQFLID